jgi:hypothetical protein
VLEVRWASQCYVPLNCACIEEMLLSFRTDHTWQPPRSASTAFFHCLSVCGHVLQILEGVTGDMQAWRRDGGASCASPRALLPADTCTQHSTVDNSISASVFGTLPGVASAVPWQQIGQDWKVLLETMPKVQATACRFVPPQQFLTVASSL